MSEGIRSEEALRLEQESRGLIAQRLAVARLGRCSYPLATLFAGGIVLGFTDGFGSREAVILYGGSLVALVTMFFYVVPSVLRSYGRPKKLCMWRAAIGGLVPYLWALYVIFVAGAWSAWRANSLWTVMGSLFFVVVGYWYLKEYWKLTEQVKVTDRVVDEAAPGGA